jgi:hypothetical protein
MAGLQYIGLISCVKKFNILTVSQNRDSMPNCHIPQKCYKSRVVYFSPDEFFTDFWPLATGLWQLVFCHWSLADCLWVGQQQEASSQ